jgi:N-acetylneuraminic acid mutarotase
MNVLHHYLVVFGGLGDEGVYLNDVFIYNTQDDEWYEVRYAGSNQ